MKSNSLNVDATAEIVLKFTFYASFVSNGSFKCTPWIRQMQLFLYCKLPYL